MAIEGSVDEAKALFKPPEDSQGKVVVGLPPQEHQVSTQGHFSLALAGLLPCSRKSVFGADGRTQFLESQRAAFGLQSYSPTTHYLTGPGKV